MRECSALLCANSLYPPLPPSVYLSSPVEICSTTKYAEKGSHCQGFLLEPSFSPLKKRYSILLSRVVAIANWPDPVSGKDELFLLAFRYFFLLSLGEDKLPQTLLPSFVHSSSLAGKLLPGSDKL